VKARLIQKRVEAKNTISFIFKPEKQITYLPGQYMYFTLPEMNFKDSRGATRHFTLSSSPTEDYIMFTTRIRESSGFKKTFGTLKVGSDVEIEGPNGTFILDENEAGSHVLITGGIGITPFRSFLKYKVDKKLTYRAHLIYSNSTPEEITFKTELLKFAETDDKIKINMSVSKPESRKEKWTGLRGRIDEELLNKLVTQEDMFSSTFWLCGPPSMVDDMEKLLIKMEVKADYIQVDKFTGY
jgi:ferredoxin-NADP reductase